MTLYGLDDATEHRQVLGELGVRPVVVLVMVLQGQDDLHVYMAVSRLRSTTARMSSSWISRASFGSGRGVRAPISPPALLTRMSMWPNSSMARSTRAATCRGSVRSAARKEERR